MEFKVLGEDQLQTFKTDKTHVLISIRSPQPEAGQANVPYLESRIGTLFMKFPDWDVEIPKNYKYDLFSKEDAKTILRFAFGVRDIVDMIVCQCEAGISRSAGVAGALSFIMNGDDSYFFKHYLPNRRVYRLILESYYGVGM